ncbi:predicted protein [Uncinocarpus reesii 1704]|uniref:Uncharacterized protein n=1 Tax=Uncinocarpus reesii (strain UAMH 1704) TaxID=336963 RepID=C4JSB1_UNCRE|nr:uncharacterized protein UREG_05350 [Uncinocarpus reesii 1704]EEP80508.1 predicted protein [Uncinocarpus reesii 1704]
MPGQVAQLRTPRTPRTPRARRCLRHDSSPAPRSWHGQHDPRAGRLPRYRPRIPNVIFKRSTHPRSPKRCRRRPRWRQNKLSDDTANPLRSMFSSLSVNDQKAETGVDCTPEKKFQACSPNTRERSFAEIINGALDQNPSGEASGFPNPFGNPGRHPFQPTLNASSPEIKVEPISPVSLFSGPPQPRSQMPTTGALGNFGFGSDQNLFGPKEPSRRLLELVRLNHHRSKELAELVDNFLRRYPGYSQEQHPKTSGNSHGSDHEGQDNGGFLPVAPYVATIPGGGDSPPRYPNGTFRGHMVDQPDAMQPVLSSHASQATTRSTSVAAEEERYPYVPPTPVLAPRDIEFRNSWKLDSGALHAPFSNSGLVRDGCALRNPLCSGRNPCSGHCITNTFAALPPEISSPEELRRVRCSLAPSPEPARQFSMDGIEFSGHAFNQNAHQGCGSGEATPQARETVLWGSETVVNGIDKNSQKSELSLGTLNAETFNRPSRREFFRPNAIQPCPCTPASSPNSPRCTYCGSAGASVLSG